MNLTRRHSAAKLHSGVIDLISCATCLSIAFKRRSSVAPSSLTFRGLSFSSVTRLIMLVSQGVISRNYDDSQYDGLILD
jgi:hypothetical protein